METQCGDRHVGDGDQVYVCTARGKHSAHREVTTQGQTLCAWTDDQAPVTFTVKIWYWSGAFEELPGVDEENALAYFAEAGHSVRVQAAEVHAANGSLSQGFRHKEPVEQVDTAGQR